MRASSSVVRPSQRLMNSAFIIAVTSWSFDCLERRNESISSIKTIVGWIFLASVNTPFTNFWDSPNHFSVRVEILKSERRMVEI